MSSATFVDTGRGASAGQAASSQPGDLTWSEGEEGLTAAAAGDWTFDHLSFLERRCGEFLAHARRTGSGKVSLDLLNVNAMDTSGAWLLQGMEQRLAAIGRTADLLLRDRRHQKLLAEVKRVSFEAPAEPLAPNGLVRLINGIGRATCDAFIEAARLLSFFGQTVAALFRSLLHPSRLRITSLTHHLEQTCLNALPIVGLIAFLIGVVMAYQGADQLKRFGAEIFTVDLVGVSILREIGILLTAIVVAGRSGSAFTAEIGAMVVNQEVDALRTLGLDPIEVLVLPRMIALMVALPLLAFFADILGLLGGGLMAWLVLGITPGQFMTQLETAIVPATFWVGIIKAPVFAFLIALVGCYQGLLVSGSADSVGRHTTSSVVIGIFLVIVFDALFSILFSALGV
jgi:phospholipid/cholesterol/gamma-HCH transport system permease protein